MSVEQPDPMGVKHLTVVPENFEPGVDPEGDRDAAPDDTDVAEDTNGRGDAA